MMKCFGKVTWIGLSVIFGLMMLIQGCGGGNGGSGASVLTSGDVSRFVSFHSDATNLVPNDTNGLRDVFVYNSQTGQIVRVNVASDGTPAAGGDSEYPALSADGRYTAFRSDATNLVSGDTNGQRDIFVHDSQTGQTTRVSVSSIGVQANGSSDRATISADGRYVAFHSNATNLVAGDTNGSTDVFVHDRQTATTVRVSVTNAGLEANEGSDTAAISADGRYVAFQSDATNLVAGDTNGWRDIFVRDRQAGQTIRVSLASDGTPANDDSARPTLSTDGRYVAFESDATNLVSGDTNGQKDIFVHDSQTGQTTRVNLASNGDQALSAGSEKGVISGDGRYVAFHSDATNLVAGDINGQRDIFLHDRQTGQTQRVSVASNGAEATGGINEYPTLSADGRFVAWQSDATNLVSNDTNGLRDIFIHDSETAQTTRASVSSSGAQANGHSYDPSY